MPHSLYPWGGPGTHFTGGWVSPRAGLDVYGNSYSNWDSVPRPSSP